MSLNGRGLARDLPVGVTSIDSHSRMNIVFVAHPIFPERHRRRGETGACGPAGHELSLSSGQPIDSVFLDSVLIVLSDTTESI